ncbi:cytochrome b/b6 domain-containing protein [Acidisphaera sp. S103]|uniref:cytochrome b/b6 domain-containing protein n=1 Tax=Acidisphaera sp. S103 TaxID=1747223 RepID=UPI00131C3A6A|nr:cytochrome b/b6 domain-containing protein [Acidisphaera sp. S103]
MRRIKVWDLPVRLFHWLLVALILAAWVTQYLNRMTLHVWIGEWILTLLLFRVVWGFIGSDTARFSWFLRSPLAALRHLAHLGRREPDREIGHNAAGGWMVLVMLALIGIQVGTGLCANDLDDGGDTEGPLMHLVGKDRSDWLTHIHGLNFTAIEAVIVLHVLAIVAYAVLKRHNLVRPMVTGTKLLPADVAAPRVVNPVWALVVLAAAFGAVVWVVKS